MKINSYAAISPLFGKIKETNQDKQGGAGQNAYERQKKKDPEEDSKKDFKASLEEVQDAVEGFLEDETNLAHGISADTEGNGPGLKVVLKDPNGGVLRSVSGEEFLRLREAVSAGAKSGRILDQKV